MRINPLIELEVIDVGKIVGRTRQRGWSMKTW